ncbi:MAG TPA: amidohydrolase family protein, partial [Bdellovibrionota bacterium]|nr:amidohydrolase family protein [Bdellovibrionota bacterium]
MSELAKDALGASGRLFSRRVVLKGRKTGPALVSARDGRITAVDTGVTAAPQGAEDLGDWMLLPGVVDTHAHINEPGRTEWEGFHTGTRAAAAGGISTVVDMPLNSIPATTTLAALEIKAKAAAPLCRIDYGFWGGVVPGNAAELEPMVRAGALGFKCFLIDSGVDEFQMVTDADLRKAIPILAKLGVPLLVHAEVDCGAEVAANADPRRYSTYLASRPQRWEVEAIRRMIALSREFRCRVHIVHLSAADALDELARAKAEGVPITAETCPHYLC